MQADASSLRARLDAWREQGADRIAPLRFHRLDALQRRAQACGNQAREVLEARLSALAEDYAGIVAAAGARDAPVAMPTRGALGQLLDTVALARTSASASEAPDAADAADANAAPGNAPSASPAHLQEMDTLRDLRRIWSGVRNRSQLRQSLEQTAEDAGPLNSSRLVHRMLSFMGRQSPGYLEHFLSYADTLSWLERMQDRGASAAEAATTSGAKRPRRKPRTGR